MAGEEGEERRLGDGTSQAPACCVDVPVCGNDASNLKPCLSLGRGFFCKISRVGAAAMHETNLITRIEGVTHELQPEPVATPNNLIIF